MKSQVRYSVFETNSSSVHTLSLPQGECEETLTIKNGKVRIPCGDFSESGVVWGLHEKLSYLCSFAVLDHPSIEPKQGCMSSEDNWDLDSILSAIQKRYPEAMELIATKCHKAQFDHQTHPCNSSCIVNLWDTEALETFLFNDEIKINMGRD